jgi:hypothetical protein
LPGRSVRDVTGLVLGIAGVGVLLSSIGLASGAGKLVGIVPCAAATGFGLDRHADRPRDRRGSAAIILGEPLGLHEWAAMALTLGGVPLALQKA